MKKITNNKVYISSQKEIIKEWNFARNKGKDPTTYLINSEEMVWWKCKKGHEWEEKISKRVKGSKCPGCTMKTVIDGFNDLSTLAPIIALEWDNEKNGLLKPNQVACCSNKKAWWKCKNGHSWQAVISSRYRGCGCPYCNHKKVLEGYNDLKTINPILAKEWNYNKNGKLKPQNYMANSNQKVWWICNKGHEWEASIETRNNRGYGCPFCAGKRVIKGKNDLATLNPELATEWDYDKNNDLMPYDVTYQSHKKVWWKCKNGHSWQAAISTRQNGRGCPVCANKIIIPGLNDLATLNPELAEEWAYRRNGRLTPKEVGIGSNKRVWWECSEGHEFEAVINCRNDKESHCPVCTNRKIRKGFNDLKTLNPKLAKEWNFKKNKEKPTEVGCNSNKIVWWKCRMGHEWKAKINDRNRGTNCPFCYRIKQRKKGIDNFRKTKNKKNRYI